MATYEIDAFNSSDLVNEFYEETSEKEAISKAVQMLRSGRYIDISVTKISSQYAIPIVIWRNGQYTYRGG